MKISQNLASAPKLTEKLPKSTNRLKVKVEKMIKIMTDEFNCNHQADLDSSDLQKIYERDTEHKTI